MSNTNLVELVVKQPLILKTAEREYVIEFPLSAVIKAEEKLGRSLKAPADWFGAPAKDIPALLEAGLSKHHPDVTPEEIQAICDGISPEAYTEFTEAIGAVAFPRWLARFKENLEKLKGTSPKAPSVDAL
jgi:hypothetical protein